MAKPKVFEHSIRSKLDFWLVLSRKEVNLVRARSYQSIEHLRLLSTYSLKRWVM